jgi:hypothetical protein
MKQSAKTTAAKPPATRPAVMFLRAVSRSTAGFLSVRAVRGSPRADQPARVRSPDASPGDGWGPAADAREPTGPVGRRPPSVGPTMTVRAGCGRGESGGYEKREGFGTGASRERHESAPGPSPEGAEGAPRAVRDLRGCLLRHGRSSQPRRSPDGLPWFGIHLWRGFRTTRVPRPPLRGSKWSPCAHSEARRSLTARIPSHLRRIRHRGATGVRRIRDG